ncbi:MAG: DUF748 domain-containing protein, partial [Betaproteobacteria bacterium]
KSAPSAPAPSAQDAGSVFPLSIERVRIEHGVVEFGDNSLPQPFRTRMYELKGVITGLGTDPASRAKLQLDARVDEYGQAKIDGEINLLRPQAYADVEMKFRNLDMTKITSYAAKFAGYQIAAGTMSMDLHYRIKDNQLVGNNKIVLNKLELGKKVETAKHLDFSVEMAIAILKDANGVIDVDLPVTGNLKDPKFDYGAIVSKAIGNLITGIITAPFRALAALFGGGEQDIGVIEFAPGTAELSPPERQKLQTVARALKNRPRLRLAVHPAYATNTDLAALKSVGARREVSERMGIKLTPKEDPGPIDLSNPRAQRAVEAIFTQRYSGSVLKTLERRLETGTSGANGGDTAQTVAATLHGTLLGRVIDAQPIAEPALRELAAQRGAAIVTELTSVGGVDAARISRAQDTQARQTGDKTVAIRLELQAAR